MPEPVDPWAIVNDLIFLARDRARITRVNGDDLGALYRVARDYMAALGIPEIAPEDRPE